MDSNKGFKDGKKVLREFPEAVLGKIRVDGEEGIGG
jgi:hypothetical protein